jgi:tripartite-type tricarboxylate transporter receptor subunit TctC
MMAGIEMVHVPYRGAAGALTDLLTGQVQVMVTAAPNEHIKNGNLKPLAITSASRSEELPDIPAVSEFPPGYESSAWFGIAAPVGTPADVIGRLNAGVQHTAAAIIRTAVTAARSPFGTIRASSRSPSR